MSEDLDSIKVLLEQGHIDAARRRLSEWTPGPFGSGDEEIETADLAASVGLGDLAVRILRSIPLSGPQRIPILTRLALFSVEGGRAARGAVWLLRVVEAGDRSASSLEDLFSLLGELRQERRADELLKELANDPAVSAEELARLAALARPPVEEAERTRDEEPPHMAAGADAGASDAVRFMEIFAGREGIYARQWWDATSRTGGYSPVREPLTERAIRNHLLGNVTVGVYPVRLDGTVAFMALDLDIGKRQLEAIQGDVARAREVRDALNTSADRLVVFLEGLGLAPLIEDSGYKGRHLWVFFSESIDAPSVHRFGDALLRVAPPPAQGLTVEFFPKQGRTRGGPGNLIKLPLGVHRRTGRRSRLLGPDGKPVEDPMQLLRSHLRVDRETFLEAARRVSRLPRTAQCSEPEAEFPASAGTASEEAAAHAGPPRPELAPAWTDADFELDRPVSHLLQRCPVLADLRRQVQETRQLGADEQIVVRHTLGHMATGLLAANYLFDRCGDVPLTMYLQSTLKGNPISCARIRQRVPQVMGHVACECDFAFAPESYPHPLLHLKAMPFLEEVRPAESEVTPSPEDLGRNLGVLLDRQNQLQHEIDQVRKVLLQELESRGEDRVSFEDGEFVVSVEPGVPPSLEWRPASQPDAEKAAS